jgi:hypothetical protein
MWMSGAVGSSPSLIAGDSGLLAARQFAQPLLFDRQVRAASKADLALGLR